MTNPLPPGFERCKDCGEARGTTRAKYLNWGDHSLAGELFEAGLTRLMGEHPDPKPDGERPVTVHCLCDGVPCSRCGVHKIHRPQTNRYCEKYNKALYRPWFSAYESCEVCRPKVTVSVEEEALQQAESLELAADFFVNGRFYVLAREVSRDVEEKFDQVVEGLKYADSALPHPYLMLLWLTGWQGTWRRDEPLRMKSFTGVSAAIEVGRSALAAETAMESPIAVLPAAYGPNFPAAGLPISRIGVVGRALPEGLGADYVSAFVIGPFPAKIISNELFRLLGKDHLREFGMRISGMKHIERMDGPFR